MTIHSAYIILTPSEPAHRQLIQIAIKARDKPALRALKGKTHKPIYLVTNWFYYGLMQQDLDPPDAAIIYSPQTRLDYQRNQHRSPAGEEETIPLNTYDFLR